MVKQSEKTVVTAALPYANGTIHIGHLLEYIQADVFVRYLKLIGKDALYICASDMHGTPVELNAKKAGMEPGKFANSYWKEHQKDFASFLINFDNYYKTHSPENEELANFFFNELKKKGHIYLKEMDVMYCHSCKRSLPDRYVKGSCPNCNAEDQYGDVCEKCSKVLKGVDLLKPYCAICKKMPVKQKSKHYFFKLSSFSKQLKQWINSKEANIQPEIKNWLNKWLKSGLEDWCISRDEPYFGFEIPNSKKEAGEKKYFYVWLDAPIGYISSTKNLTEKWKDYWYGGKIYHFIGKDIVYFHLLFWPAMLQAVGIKLPEITVHGFITVDGKKMSKSRGTFFTAKDFLDLYPAETLRFYYAYHLDRKVVDVDLSFKDLQAVTNNVLMGNLGNFCYRTLVFVEKNYGKIKKIRSDKKLEKKINDLAIKVKINYEKMQFKLALKNILKISDLGNAYFQSSEPWKDKPGREGDVGLCLNIARNLSILVSPILPAFSKKIWKALGEKNLEMKDLGFKFKGDVGKIEKLVKKVEKLPEAKNFPLLLKVGRIVEVKDHPNADSLYLFKVDFGGKFKQVVTSLKKHLPIKVFLNKKTVFCLNLKPAKFRGEISEAMILAGEEGKKIELLEAKGKEGTLVAPLGMNPDITEISFADFEKVKMVVEKGKVLFEGKPLTCGEVIIRSKLKNGSRVH